MGTRHLICIVADGAYKLAQYGQWDGYPSGQGQTILESLREPGMTDRLREGAGKLWVPTKGQLETLYVGCGARVQGDTFLLDGDASDKLARLYPGLSRETGSAILPLIAKTVGPLPVKSNTPTFAGDSLFCEWAYVIDFDKGTFEVFEGFNQEPLAADERFADQDQPNNDYRPVRFKKAYPLVDLPTVEAFLVDLEPQEKVA